MKYEVGGRLVNRRSLIALFTLFVFIAASVVINVNCNRVAAKARKEAQPFKVAAVQFNPELNNREKNVTELLTAVEQAFQNGAKLVVAPEMSTTGYYYKDREAIRPFVDSIPGDTTTRFSVLAKKYDAYVVFGMPEVDTKTGLYYNAAALVGPEGYIGKYRKTHQWETEAHWAAWGDLGVPVFDTKLGKIAMNICMDSAYFESARLAAIGGADILAFPTNSSAQAIAALPARAEQNGMYVISANRSNTEKGFHMIGASAVWSPLGNKLVEAPLIADKGQDVNQATIVYADVDPRQYRNKNKEVLKNRRPSLYKELMLYIEPWDYTKTTAEHNVTVAALQFEPIVGNKIANRQKATNMLSVAQSEARLAGKELGLAVMPELSATGPLEKLSTEEIVNLAEVDSGETATFMAELARSNQIALVFGFVETDNGKLYNSTLLIAKDGNVVGKYRKTHLNANDKKWAEAGSDLPIFEVKGLGKIGLLIGEDALYPEASGVLAVKRADIIVIPSAWHGQYSNEMTINKNMSSNKYPEGALVVWDAVAMGAQAYTLVANFVGSEKQFLGRSGLYTLDPLYGLDQPVVATVNKEQALVVSFKTLQSKWWFNQENLLLSRRTPYYVPLVVE
jgi:predicted amidohydrolase